MKKSLPLLFLLGVFVLGLCACSLDTTTETKNNSTETQIETQITTEPTPAIIMYSLENKTAEEIVQCTIEILHEPLDMSCKYSDFIKKLKQTYSHTLYGEYKGDEISYVSYGIEEAMDGSIAIRSADNGVVFLDMKLKDFDKASQVYELLKPHLQPKYKDVKETKGNTRWSLVGSFQDYNHPEATHAGCTIIEMSKCQDNTTNETYYQIRCCTLRDRN